MKKATLIKLSIICLAAVVCGVIVGVLFSIFFYGLLPRDIGTEVYLADTHAKMHLRFWIAFAVGAVIGIIWAYRVVKDFGPLYSDDRERGDKEA